MKQRREGVKRRVLSILVFVLVLISTVVICVPARADEVAGDGSGDSLPLTGTCGDNITWTYDETHTLRFEGEGAIKQFYLTERPWYCAATNGCQDIEMVFVGEGITSIPTHCLCGLKSMTSLTLPSTLQSIGSYSIADNNALKTLTIPASLTSAGEAAFTSCKGLERVVFEEGSQLEDLPTRAFEDCASLREVILPGSLKEIGSKAFVNCASLESANIPDSVELIRWSAYENCTSLKSVTLPKSGCAVESRVFYNSPNLTSMFIPSGMIGYGGFDSPTGLAANYVTNVTLADGITVLGGLGGFERLTSLDIPNTVTEITQYAFDGCSAIERMYVPDTVESIGSCAFSSMGALKELRLPEGISDVDFVRDCPLLETVNLPTSVNWIGDQAFRDLPCLRSLRVTDSVHSLSDYPQYGNRPFMNCPNLVLELDEGCITQDYAEKYGIPYTIAKPKTDLSQASAWGIANDETVGYDYVFVKMPDGTALDSYWDFTFENETRDGKRGALIKGAHTYMGELWLPVPSAKSPQTITCASIKTLAIGKRVSLSAKSSAGTQLVYYSSAPKVLSIDAKGNVTAKTAGKAQITIAAPETTTHKQAVKTITVTVAKKANTLLAKRTKVSVACASTKTKAQVVSAGIKVSKAIGSVSYANASTNRVAKKFKINAKNGKVTVPKGTKKGSYPVKIRVAAGGNASYNKGVKVVSLSIKVK